MDFDGVCLGMLGRMSSEVDLARCHGLEPIYLVDNSWYTTESD